MQTCLGIRGHLITNLPPAMPLLIINACGPHDMALVVLQEIGLEHISKNVNKNVLLMAIFRQIVHMGVDNLVPRAFCFRSAKMALASAGHMTSKSPVFGVFNYDNLCV